MKIVFWDIETRFLVGEKTTQGQVSWSHPERMGIAVACTFETVPGQAGIWRDWLEGEADALANYLSKADLVVGFNSIHFDTRVLNGCLSADLFANAASIIGERQVDLLMDVHTAAGKRIGLDALAQSTLDVHKPMDGTEAPIGWREGQRMEVIRYCRFDVRMVYELFNHQGPLSFIDKKTGYPQDIHPTWHVRGLDRKPLHVVPEDAYVYHRRITEKAGGEDRPTTPKP